MDKLLWALLQIGTILGARVHKSSLGALGAAKVQEI